MIHAFNQPIRHWLNFKSPLTTLFSMHHHRLQPDHFVKARAFSQPRAQQEQPDPTPAPSLTPALQARWAKQLNPFRRRVAQQTEPLDLPFYPVPRLQVVRPQHKLMSYNVENFVKTSRGKMIKSPSSVQALADAILQEDPDVIALQEVGDPKLLAQFNEKHLGNRYPHMVCTPTASPSDIRVAMISKGNLRVVNQKSHLKEMSQGANYPHKRDLLEATFQTPSGFQFTVYNAHCHSMVGGEEKTAPIRMQEVRNLSGIVKHQLNQHPNAPVFVAGDFNLRHDTAFGQPILDALTHLDDPAQPPVLTEVMMKDGKPEPTHNGNGHYPNHKLDYIFASQALLPQIKSAYVAGDFVKAPWRKASDHLPYVTVFEELPPPMQAKNNILPLPFSQEGRMMPGEEHSGGPSRKRRRLHFHA